VLTARTYRQLSLDNKSAFLCASRHRALSACQRRSRAAVPLRFLLLLLCVRLLPKPLSDGRAAAVCWLQRRPLQFVVFSARSEAGLVVRAPSVAGLPRRSLRAAAARARCFRSSAFVTALGAAVATVAAGVAVAGGEVAVLSFTAAGTVGARLPGERSLRRPQRLPALVTGRHARGEGWGLQDAGARGPALRARVRPGH
jgi:hypothetical protein